MSSFRIIYCDIALTSLSSLIVIAIAQGYDASSRLDIDVKAMSRYDSRNEDMV